MIVVRPPDCYGRGMATQASTGPRPEVERVQRPSSEPSFDLVESKLHPPPSGAGSLLGPHWSTGWSPRPDRR